MAISKIIGSGLGTINSPVEFTTADNLDQLTLTSTDADANSGPNLRLYRNSGSPADSDVLGIIEFEGRNDASQDVVYAGIDSRIVDASDGTEDGRLELVTMLAGTAGISRILMDASETVFNDNSVDLNFRVESNGNANMLFVDGGNDKIGINTSSPDAIFTVDSNVGGSSTGTLARFHSSKGESDSTYLQIAATRHGTASVQRVQLQAFDDDGSTGRTLALNPSGGNIGIATNTPSDLLHLQGGGANDSVGAPIIRLQKTSGGAVDDGQTIGGISWFVNDSGVQSGASYERAKIIAESQNTSSGARLEFWTGNSNADIAERFRIQADGRLVQTHQGTTTGAVNLLGESGSSSKAITFAHVGNGAEVGTIVTGASSTTYNTSSDYRLKENVDYTWDATTRLKQLKPARFNFIIDDTNTPVDGFLAHEVSSIVPEAVSGVKDRVEVWENGEELPDGVSVGDNKLDKDGNTIPNYQGIDQSKLVPLLVKTIQELEARIKTLEDA